MVATLLAGSVSAGALLADSGGTGATLEFNHKVHIAGKVDCLQCHEGVLDRTAARMPDIETCAGCHTDAPPPDNAEKVKLAALAAEKATLSWPNTMVVPDHVFFPHLIHVDVANIECLTCHAYIPEKTAPTTDRRVIEMDDCIDCHEEHRDRPAAVRAALDCAACHR